MQYIYKDDSGESITNHYRQTVKHENKWIAENTKFAVKHDVVETLDVFDENNWEYLYNSRIIHASPYKVTPNREIKESMVNGKYYESLNDNLFGQIYRCGK